MCESEVCLSGIQGIQAIFLIVGAKSQRKVASESKEGLIWARGLKAHSLKAHGLKAHGLKAHSLKVQSAIEKAQEQKRQAAAHLHPQPEWRKTNAGVRPFPLLIQCETLVHGMVLPTFRVGPSCLG